MMNLKKIPIIHKRIKHKRIETILPKIREYENIQGWLKPIEAVHLTYFASLLPSNSVIVEIGSWKGKSTFCLAKGLKDGKIYAIDPFNAAGEKKSQDTYQEAQGNIDLFDHFIDNMQKNGIQDEVQPLKGFSKDFVGKFEGIDLLFIDGDHSIEGCLFDYENYHKYIVKGGYLLFHDYYPEREDLGPTWVIHNKVIPSKFYKHIGNFGNLWIGKKIK